MLQAVTKPMALQALRVETSAQKRRPTIIPSAATFERLNVATIMRLVPDLHAARCKNSSRQFFRSWGLNRL